MAVSGIDSAGCARRAWPTRTSMTRAGFWGVAVAPRISIVTAAADDASAVETWPAVPASPGGGG